MDLFAESVNKNDDGIKVVLGFGELHNEVHGDLLPVCSGNRKRLQEALRLLGGGLVSLAEITGCYKFSDVFGHLGPVENPLK